MKKIIYLLILVLAPALVYAQRTIINTGNWNDPTTWTGNIIASGLSDNVFMNDGVAIAVAGSDSSDVGSFITGLNNQLSIAAGGHLGIGDNGDPRDFTANNNMTITAAGRLIIWGDLIVSNNLIMSITGVGEVIIMGNVQMANGATFTVNGNLQVGGDFTGGNNTNVNVGPGGSINVDGTLTVGIGSHVNLSCDSYASDVNCGTFHAHACAPDIYSQAFCTTLPVELIFFRATAGVESVKLTWATASELNFDYFIVEKSRDGKAFFEIASVSGSKSPRSRNDYAINDEKPTLGKSYYRLREVDIDGTSKALKLVEVNYTGAKSLNLFPNPLSGGDLNFELNFVPEQEVSVTIVDLRGVTLSEFRLNSQYAKLPMQLPAGAYVVMLQTNGFRSVSKLMVK